LPRFPQRSLLLCVPQFNRAPLPSKCGFCPPFRGEHFHYLVFFAALCGKACCDEPTNSKTPFQSSRGGAPGAWKLRVRRGRPNSPRWRKPCGHPRTRVPLCTTDVLSIPLRAAPLVTRPHLPCPLCLQPARTFPCLGAAAGILFLFCPEAFSIPDCSDPWGR